MENNTLLQGKKPNTDHCENETALDSVWDTIQGGVPHQVLSSGPHTSHAQRAHKISPGDTGKAIIQTGSDSMKVKQQKKINEIKRLVFLSQCHGGAAILWPFPLGPSALGPWPLALPQVLGLWCFAVLPPVPQVHYGSLTTSVSPVLRLQSVSSRSTRACPPHLPYVLMRSS